MDDRELLELAAKASGVDGEWLDQSAIEHDAATVGLWLKGARGPDNSQYWNPLTDDGDALRLAVKVGMGVQANGADHWQSPNCTIVLFGEQSRLTEAHGSDPFSATRRAITRAAATLAKGEGKV